MIKLNWVRNDQSRYDRVRSDRVKNDSRLEIIGFPQNSTCKLNQSFLESI